MSAFLTGYVVIEQPLNGLSKVIGRKWTRDYPEALLMASRDGGTASARSWVAGKLGHDPVVKHGLKEIVVAKDSKKARAKK